MARTKNGCGQLLYDIFMTLRIVFSTLMCWIVAFICFAVQWLTWKLACLITYGRERTWNETQFDYCKENSDGRCDAFHQLSGSSTVDARIAKNNPEGDAPELHYVDEDNTMAASRRAMNLDDTGFMGAEELIQHAKTMAAANFGMFSNNSDKWLSEDFVFIFPIIFMDDKKALEDVLKSLRIENTDTTRAFYYGWQVDCFEPNRVWAKYRQTEKVDGKWVPLGVQELSWSFDKSGKCYKFTGGYIIDRTINYNNCGGLGAAVGQFWAQGRPLPFTETYPYYPSLEFNAWLTALYSLINIWRPWGGSSLFTTLFYIVNKISPKKVKR